MGTIYKISNIKNNHFYIGYTTSSIENRFSRHIINAKYGGTTHLYRAIRKYGHENFMIESLQDRATFADEKGWISKLKPQYNMTAGGEGGDTSSSENFKNGVAQYHAQKERKSYATFGFLGKRHSEKSKGKQSDIRKSFWKSNPDQLQKLKIRTTGSKNPMFGKTPANAQPITIDNVTYPSLTAASKAIGKCGKTLKKYATR